MADEARARREEQLLEWVTEKCQSGDNIELEEGWTKIKDHGTVVLESILTGTNEAAKPFGHKGYSGIYTLSYRMCSQPAAKDWSEDLYKRHAESIQSYLERIAVPALKAKHDIYLLHDFIKHWENHKLMVKWMYRLFMHLDKAYIVNGSLPTLTSAGLKLFKTIVYDGFRTDLMTTMLAVINRERDGEEVDHVLLRTMTQVFETMGVTQSNTSLKNLTSALNGAPDLQVYTNDFEDFLLTNTQEYYAQKSQQWLERDSTPEYMIKAERALLNETKRVGDYLNRCTEPKLLKVVETQILQQHQTHLMEKEGSGCRVLLNDDQLDDLRRMYQLFSRIPDGLPPMAAIFKEHVEQKGVQVVEKRQATIATLAEQSKKEVASDPDFVEQMLACHEKYEKVVMDQFAKHSLFQKALKEACIVFVNKDASKKHSNTEMLSTYCDRILKGGEKLGDDQIEKLLCDIMKLFNFLADKDLFAEIFRNQLAKRLLNRRSVSNEAEKSMIGKLKMQCGAPFTSKLEGMVTDHLLCEDSTKQFGAHVGPLREKGELPNVDFSVQVLTTGFWPTYKLLDVLLPTDMRRCVDTFAKWYDSKTQHRRLKWIHAIGEATVRGNFSKKGCDMVVTTLQAVTLVFFGDNPGQKTFAQVKEGLNVDTEIVKRVVHSLSCGKHRVLTKEPMSKTIKETDTFSVNMKFTSKMHKFRIPMASLDESHNPKRVDEDRSFAIDAAIVRIMKARKVLAHMNLVQEVLTQLHFFRPEPKAIKKRIEQLIEREYLERDSTDPKKYQYMA
jgi:cullin 1